MDSSIFRVFAFWYISTSVQHGTTMLKKSCPVSVENTKTTVIWFLYKALIGLLYLMIEVIVLVQSLQSLVVVFYNTIRDMTSWHSMICTLYNPGVILGTIVPGGIPVISHKHLWCSFLSGIVIAGPSWTLVIQKGGDIRYMFNYLSGYVEKIWTMCAFFSNIQKQLYL
jgi:hypothetical protein